MTSTSDPAKGLNAAVAATLNGERGASGLTFEQLSRRVGISTRQLKRLLSEKSRHIDVDSLAALAAVFRMSPIDVITLAVQRMERPDEPVNTLDEAIEAGIAKGRRSTRSGNPVTPKRQVG